MPKVLLTREKSQELASYLKSSGFEVVEIKAIEIESIYEKDKFPNLCTSLEKCDFTLFTSSNAAKSFIKIAKDCLAESLTPKFKIVAVGEATKKTLLENGFNVDLMPEKYSSKELFKLLEEKQLLDKKFLYITGNKHLDYLPTVFKNIGGSLEVVEVYENKKPDSVDLEFDRLIAENSLDCIVFFSPSAAQNLFDSIYKHKLLDIKVVTIGETTLSACEKLGFKNLFKSPKATNESVFDTIKNIL